MSLYGIPVDLYIPIWFDSDLWEERIRYLIDSTNEEYNSAFRTVDPQDKITQLMFILYPVARQEKIKSDRILDNYIRSRTASLHNVVVIACGSQVGNCPVDFGVLVELIDDQCIKHGLSVTPIRSIRPEDLDTDLKKILVKMTGWQTLGRSSQGLGALGTPSAAGIPSSSDGIALIGREDI